MSRVIAALTMSLDGFIAQRDDGVGPLFDWYGNGEVEVRWPGMQMVSHTTAESAGYLRDVIAEAGALVVGRRLFDYTKGWGGEHPVKVPVFVVTHREPPRDWIARHPDAPFEFVTEGGVEAAIARASAVAGESRTVSLSGANVAQQALNAGLLDEIHVQLAPVLLGEGIRFFDDLRNTPVMLDDPEVIEGKRVTHLIYRVVRR